MSEKESKQENKLKDDSNRFVEVSGVVDESGKARDEDEEVTEFDDMGLKDEVKRAIYTYGYEKPTKIQRVILPLTQSKPPIDLIVQSPCETGKTVASVVSMLQNLDENKKELQGLVVVPARELAIQTFRVFLALSQYMKFKIHCCVDETKLSDDLKKMEEGQHIVIGTPGILTCLMEKKALPVNGIKMLVIDEFEEWRAMLSRRLICDIEDQLHEMLEKYLPKNIQICLFCATMPREVVSVVEKFMDNPVKILKREEEKNKSLENIKQFFVNVKLEKKKYATLCDLYKHLKITKAIIFCNTKKRVDMLAEKMNKDDHTVSKLHAGIKKEEECGTILKNFRSGSTRVLITTDMVIIEGIKFQQMVSVVINYDLPRQKEVYERRIGITTRYGRKTVSINLLTDRDLYRQKDLERYYHTKIEPLPKDVNKFL